MICCLVSTLVVLFNHRQDQMAFDSLTNWAVMIVLGIVLFCASMVTVKKLAVRWWRDNSIASLRIADRTRGE